MSDDGEFAIVIIALQGNPFSPHYAAERARASSPPNPRSFSAFNVALYRRGEKAWSLREGAIRACDYGPSFVSVGGSSLAWDGDALVARIDQRTTPFQRRLRGIVRFHPPGTSPHCTLLDHAKEHAWCPVAPVGIIDVAFDDPSVRFRGLGYHDANFGSAGLEDGFRSWNWSRASSTQGARLTYDAVDRAGRSTSATLSVNRHGEVTQLETPRLLAHRPLPRTAWGIPRFTRAEGATSLHRSLEDGPFYARALVREAQEGKTLHAMHEVLDATRLARSWVRFLTPFRMGRAC